LKKKGVVVKEEGEEKNDFESALGGDDDDNDDNDDNNDNDDNDDNNAWLTPESKKKTKGRLLIMKDIV
jgi:hypothetical protein